MKVATRRLRAKLISQRNSTYCKRKPQHLPLDYVRKDFLMLLGECHAGSSIEKMCRALVLVRRKNFLDEFSPNTDGERPTDTSAPDEFPQGFDTWLHF
jgi:hypothetical protein